MDIRSGGNYPSNALSNFAPHPFELDGVKCNSMEGFLQSLKYENQDMQVEVCKLVGLAAKRKGYSKNWWDKQTLYWRGVAYPRESQAYQDLLDRAYEALAQNSGFKKALMATGDAVLTHAMGKRKAKETILTQREFCSRLMRIRKEFQNERT